MPTGKERIGRKYLPPLPSQSDPTPASPPQPPAAELPGVEIPEEPLALPKIEPAEEPREEPKDTPLKPEVPIQLDGKTPLHRVVFAAMVKEFGGPEGVAMEFKYALSRRGKGVSQARMRLLEKFFDLMREEYQKEKEAKQVNINIKAIDDDVLDDMIALRTLERERIMHGIRE